MKFQYAFAIATALIAIPVNGVAATYSDPSWPCIQRKVEKLSLGIMWPHPIVDGEVQAELAPAVATLATKLALRRISLEETKPLIAEFAKNYPQADKNVLGKIFEKVFNRIASDRQNIIDGIEKYSFKQIALSKDIELSRTQMSELSKVNEPDFDRIDKLEEKLEWDERVYRDRAKSLTYVCETPVLLEKRLFSIAQTLLTHVKE